jgi:hypothetical protein
MAIDHSTHQEHLGAMRGEHLEGHIVRGVYLVSSTWLLDPGIICRLIQLLLGGERFHPTWSKLVKEVKDSSLNILHQIYSVPRAFVEAGRIVGGFLQS